MLNLMQCMLDVMGLVAALSTLSGAALSTFSSCTLIAARLSVLRALSARSLTTPAEQLLKLLHELLELLEDRLKIVALPVLIALGILSTLRGIVLVALGTLRALRAVVLITLSALSPLTALRATQLLLELLHDLLELLQDGLKAAVLSVLLRSLRSLTASQHLLELLESVLNLLYFLADALGAALVSSLHQAPEVSSASEVLSELLNVLNSRSQPANSFYFHRRFLSSCRLLPLAIEN